MLPAKPKSSHGSDTAKDGPHPTSQDSETAKDGPHPTRSKSSQDSEIVIVNRHHSTQPLSHKSDTTMDEPQEEVKTVKSKSTSRSRTTRSSMSHSSSYLAKMLAKAEVKKAAATYAQKEADIKKQKALLEEQKNVAEAQVTRQQAEQNALLEEHKAKLMRQQAELDADNDLLQHRRDAACAEAEIKVLIDTETEIDEGEDDRSEDKIKLPLPESDPFERTQRFVNEHFQDVKQETNQQTSGAAPGPASGPAPATAPTSGPAAAPAPTSGPAAAPGRAHALAPGAVSSPTPVPGPAPAPVSGPAPAQSTQYDIISNSLIKRDLILSRISNFNDTPETFTVWKLSFKSVVDELKLSANEEFDMLVKWLGPESSKYALSHRAAHARNPELGLQKLWDRLKDRYGAPEVVEASIKKKLTNFPKLSNRDYDKLFELSDVLSEIEALKELEEYSSLLAYYDSSSGVLPIINKLPFGLQEKWTNHAFAYKKRKKVPFPPFTEFVQFISELAKMKNDPCFTYDSAPQYVKKERTRDPPSRMFSSRKTDIDSTRGLSRCPIHKAQHSLNECRTFRFKPIEERNEFIQKHRICFKCCDSDSHIARDCTVTPKCVECNRNHPTALHKYLNQENRRKEKPKEDHGGESSSATPPTPINSKCTQICGQFNGKSCAKTFLVWVYPRGQRHQARKMYAILDDQSNVTLGRTAFFDLWKADCEEVTYTLSSCTGVINTSGRKTKDYVIESFDRSSSLDLPTVIECNQIPNNRNEIPTPDVAAHHKYLADIAKDIPPLDSSADILLLLGRDVIKAHHVKDHRIGPGNAPYAQLLTLGWVIIGEVCLNKVHKPDYVNVKKTHILPDGRSSIFTPCPNSFDVTEKPQHEFSTTKEDIFKVTQDDEKPGLSVEDRHFLHLMEREMYKGTDGNWVAPLPFKPSRQRLPNNKPQAVKRAKTLEKSMQRDPLKKQHMFEFMAKILENKHAEKAAPLKENEERWYLPLFGVYHPKKPDQIRAVFDSSAQYEGVSLNNVLLQGPDLTNSLRDILLRFRKDKVAIMADLQQMFYGFQVREDHRDFLRFLWYRDNKAEQDLIEYRMKVHVFGNSPSPAIATFGLRKTALMAQEEFGEDVKSFVDNDFYVDDGITSVPSPEEAINLLQRSQQALKKHGNIRLHKIVSNSGEVMEAFPSDDLAKNLKNLCFEEDELPLQHTLGMSWDINTDSFTYRVSQEIKPFTKRGILSTVNTLYDPLGFVAPVIIEGKCLLREFVSNTHDWDDPLPTERQEEWERWRSSIQYLETLQISRMIVSPPAHTDSAKILVYSDASQKAIASSAYLQTQEQIGFIMGKTKVAPVSGHTIPRLELCGAVLSTEVASTVCNSLNFPMSEVHYFTDSRIVLGYIHNQVRRFPIYISNRVSKIHKVSSPSQWHYVETDVNPADEATRSVAAHLMSSSKWLQGPTAVPDLHAPSTEKEYPLVDPENQETETATVCAVKLNKMKDILGAHRFERFSTWQSLVGAIARLKRLANKVNKVTGIVNAEEAAISEQFILKQIQHESFSEEIASLQSDKVVSKNSSILSLNPVLDDHGILRVGGRLNRTNMCPEQRNPIILPRKHHVSELLVRKFHADIQHQGRHFTEGAVRPHGYWIIAGRRLVNSVIHKCVTCRKHRGKFEHQKMSDLPEDRLTPGPPFTYVGVDTFGSWCIVTRRTRGGQANNKRWALLFTCLVTRAVHIELIEELSSSSFINALRRFVSIRGDVKEFRSDRGTNFVGATESLNITAINVEDNSVQKYLSDNGTTWMFNPPHASHMGGAWERMIGVARRILDPMLSNQGPTRLTHEVLSTFMAEVAAIINSRPIVPVSTDAESPHILTPATLLTQKFDQQVMPMTTQDVKDLYRSQWKQVQALSDQFWCRWKREYVYLHTLQPRRKWTSGVPNVRTGDIVLLKDLGTHRNDWPVGILDRAIQSEDGNVRKAIIRITRDGKKCVYTRPVSELVLLISKDESTDK